MAWQRTKPVASTNVESPAVRANFQAIDQALMGRNLACDSNFLIWHLYNRMAHWTFSGTGALTRETSTVKNNKHSAKVVYGGSGTDSLSQKFLHNATTAGYFAGIPFSAGVWIKSNTVSCVAKINDGTDSTSTASDGTNTWEWVTVTHTVDASPTQLSLDLDITGAGTVYYSMPTFLLGPIPPQHPIPSYVTTPILAYQKPGDPPSTGELFRISLGRPFQVIDAQIEPVSSNASTSDFVVDLQQWASTAFFSMFKSSDRPTVSTGKSRGGGQPSLAATSTADYAGAYWHSCFDAHFGTGLATGALIRAMVASIGTSTGVKLPMLNVRCRFFPNPWEGYSSYDEYR
jgi:hypothetical protein